MQKDRTSYAGRSGNILFISDQNLGAWVIERTGGKMDLWQGDVTCTSGSSEALEKFARNIQRNAPLVAHPECTYAVPMLADEVCSTEKMVTFCKESPAHERIIVVTEASMHRIGCS